MKIKRLSALLLAIIMIFSVFSVAVIAADGDSETYVARMYICTRLKFVGHVWLYFENLTDHDIKVGCYTLPANQGVTVSAYNTARKDGKGNYYNIDGYCLNKYGASKTTCAGMDLTNAQLETVNNKILSRNSWSGTKNCCYFAGSVWNSVSPKSIKILLLPSLMKNKIKAVKCDTPNFYVPTREQCFKQVGTGDSATLKQCSNGSYNRYVG